MVGAALELLKRYGQMFGSSAAEYLTFVAATGNSEFSVEMCYENENICLTQKMMATLYYVEINTVNYHLKKIFSDNKLKDNSVIRKSRITAPCLLGRVFRIKCLFLWGLEHIGFEPMTLTLPV